MLFYVHFFLSLSLYFFDSSSLHCFTLFERSPTPKLFSFCICRMTAVALKARFHFCFAIDFFIWVCTLLAISMFGRSVSSLSQGCFSASLQLHLVEKTGLRVPLQRLFYLPRGEFKDFVSCGSVWAVPLSPSLSFSWCVLTSLTFLRARAVCLKWY